MKCHKNSHYYYLLLFFDCFGLSDLGKIFFFVEVKILFLFIFVENKTFISRFFKINTIYFKYFVTL